MDADLVIKYINHLKAKRIAYMIRGDDETQRDLQVTILTLMSELRTVTDQLKKEYEMLFELPQKK
jgi:hypothetical protein